MPESDSSINELTERAKKAEKSDPSKAIELYNGILKKDDLQTNAYDRLMILYRKENDYKKELSIINSGIKAFEKFYKAESGKRSKKVSEISEKLNKAFHLVDKKGVSLYNPEPIARWQKRKETVEKRLLKRPGKANSKKTKKRAAV